MLKLLQTARLRAVEQRLRTRRPGRDQRTGALHGRRLDHRSSPGGRIVMAARLALARREPRAPSRDRRPRLVDERAARARAHVDARVRSPRRAPFVGLFGTVYGIMDAFIRIGQEKSASLPVVAPAIGEALITTAIGLAAAIPAVVLLQRHRQARRRPRSTSSRRRSPSGSLVFARGRRRRSCSAIPLAAAGARRAAAGTERAAMGASDRAASGGGGFSEINVTPLVDVMLVLLIVFMVTAPLLDERACASSCPNVQAAEHARQGRQARRHRSPRTSASSSARTT